MSRHLAGWIQLEMVERLYAFTPWKLRNPIPPLACEPGVNGTTGRVLVADAH